MTIQYFVTILYIGNIRQLGQDSQFLSSNFTNIKRAYIINVAMIITKNFDHKTSTVKI